MAQGRLTWMGHSTVLVELDGVGVLTDPVLRARVLHLRRVAAASVDGLPKPDAVLLSHAHWDHLDLPSLRRVGREVTVVCPRGLGGLLRRRGFREVLEVDAGGDLQLGALTLTATHAEHPPGRGPFQAKAPALGYVLRGSRRIYFAGDTGPFAGMAELAPVDVALLPVAGWGRKLGSGHLGPSEAAEALLLLRPRVAVPIHWGTYSPFFARRRTGREPAEEFAKRASELAPDVEVRVLEPGGTLEVE